MKNLNEPNDPKVIYNEAYKKTSELKFLDAASIFQMQMTKGGENVDMQISMDEKVSNIKKNNMLYSAQITSNCIREEIKSSMYYENGYCYLESNGKKIKYAMDMNEIINQLKEYTESGIESSNLESITVKEDVDNQILTFTAKSETMEDMAKLMMTNMEVYSEGYTIGEVSGEAIVDKEGYFTNLKFKIPLDMTVKGEKVSMVMDTEYIYNNPGQRVEVVLPELEGYTECIGVPIH